MAADCRRRFWLSLILTPPVLLSPMIQHWLGREGALDFRGSELLLFALSTVRLRLRGLAFLVFVIRYGPMLIRPRVS